MEFEKKKVQLTIPSYCAYLDTNGKTFWAFVNDAVARGEEVTAIIKGAKSNIDYGSLVQTGKDANGLPTFGIGPQTRLDLAIMMEVALNFPVTDKPIADPEKK